MTRHELIRHTLLVGSLALALTACDRKAAAPDLQTTSGPQAEAQSALVSGCLRQGEADQTFVLESAQADGAGATVTYQLTGNENVQLPNYVGQQVEVSGTVRANQEISSSGKVEEKAAKGTSGTPVVETKTDVDIKRLDVATIKSLGAACK